MFTSLWEFYSSFFFQPACSFLRCVQARLRTCERNRASEKNFPSSQMMTLLYLRRRCNEKCNMNVRIDINFEKREKFCNSILAEKSALILIVIVALVFHGPITWRNSLIICSLRQWKKNSMRCIRWYCWVIKTLRMLNDLFNLLCFVIYLLFTSFHIDL